MGTLQLNSLNLPSLFSTSQNFNNTLKPTSNNYHLSFSSKVTRIRAVETVSNTTSEATASTEEEKPGVNFTFVASVLLPDGTPDVHYRRACGGQKLRDIMLDNDIELYGPYARPLLNCAGGGTCGTCMVEVIEGKELLSPRTEKEKEKLKRNPKNWRLACQTTVGTPESRGEILIQQLPEWKAHEWSYGDPPEDDQTDLSIT